MLKKHKNIENKNPEQWIEERKNKLGDSFNGDLILITKISGIYKALRNNNINLTWHEFCENLRKVKKRIDYFETYKDTMYEKTNLEERVKDEEDDFCPF